MSQKVKDWFKSMGSSQIGNLKYREGYAFIGINGVKNGNFEKKAENAKDEVSLQQMY